MADANILQSAIFHDDMEDSESIGVTEAGQVDGLKRSVEGSSNSVGTRVKQPKDVPKPAAHRVRWTLKFLMPNFCGISRLIS